MKTLRAARPMAVVAGALGVVALVVGEAFAAGGGTTVTVQGNLPPVTAPVGPEPGTPPTGPYTGSDNAGAVSFRLDAVKSKGVHSRTTLWIRDFQLANRCATAGTTVIAKIRVGPRYRFGIVESAGLVVRGSVHREFTGNFFERTPPGYGAGETGVARGIARVRTMSCDTGKLRFTASWSR